MPPPAAPVLRRRTTTAVGQRSSAPALIAAGVVLGIVIGWTAGLVRVRTP